MAGLGLLWVGLSLFAAMAFSHYLSRQMKTVAQAMDRAGEAPLQPKHRCGCRSWPP